MRPSAPSKQTQFRLPPWATEFIERSARQHGTSKTQVVLDALRCLQEHELEELMAEGYESVALKVDVVEGPGEARDEDRKRTW